MFISSTNVEKSTQFYCDFLSFTPTKKFNEGLGDCQVVHREINNHDLELLIVPAGTATLSYAHHIAFEVDSAAEFEALLKKAKAMNLNPRANVPLKSDVGMSTFSMNDKAYQHFYVLDPSNVNIEIMWRVLG